MTDLINYIADKRMSDHEVLKNSSHTAISCWVRKRGVSCESHLKSCSNRRRTRFTTSHAIPLKKI